MLLTSHTKCSRFQVDSSKRLRTMSLQDCEIKDEVCDMMGLLPALKSLNLAYNTDITDEYLGNLKSLTVLNLSYCGNIDASNFIDICESLNLTRLNIVGCYNLDDEAFLTLVETQTSLEELIISNSYYASRIDLVGKLPALKHIGIHRKRGAYYVGTDILREIVTNRKEVLESLELYELCVTVEEENRDRILDLENLRKLCLVRDLLNDDYLQILWKNCKLLEHINIAGSDLVSHTGIINLVRNLERLEFLNITFCKRIEESLINEIYSALDEARETERKNRLNLCVYGTRIADLKEEKWQKYKTRISLSFVLDTFCIPTDLSYN